PPASQARLSSRPPRARLSLRSYTPTPTAALSTLSLHDALPISAEDLLPRIARRRPARAHGLDPTAELAERARRLRARGAHLVVEDRKSTRLNSSHLGISYAVFCLKKKTRTLPSPAPATAALPHH